MIDHKEQNNQCQAMVLVNQNRRVEIIDQQTNISELLIKLDCIESGVAIAVNNQVVTREQWPVYVLNNDDNISIFGAIAGG